MSTGRMEGVPTAMATTAWMPPSTKISSAPARCCAATMAGAGRPWNGGAQVTMRGTFATLAVTTDMWAEASSGYLPPGT